MFPSCPAEGEASDFYIVAAEEPEAIAQTVVDLVQTRLPGKFDVDPVRDIQVLCPMNRGITGARGINQALQDALNPPGEHSVEKFGYRFSVGDKVMQIENNYDRDVYNGDIGFVTEHRPRGGGTRRDVRRPARHATPLANSMNWCSATPRPSTSRRAPSTRWWSFRCRPSIT